MAQADTNARITAPDVLARKGSDEALVMVTAYDAPSRGWSMRRAPT